MSNDTTAPKGITALIYRDALGTDFSNANFRVRLIDVSDKTTKDFRLDGLAVQVTYTP